MNASSAYSLTIFFKFTSRPAFSLHYTSTYLIYLVHSLTFSQPTNLKLKPEHFVLQSVDGKTRQVVCPNPVATSSNSLLVVPLDAYTV